MNNYNSWIEGNVESPYGRCAEYTLQMQEVFPELTRVRGHYHDSNWGLREHWWLVTPDGEIVDPTKAQFPGICFGYEPLDESLPEPTGKCPECGEYCFDGNTFCCKNCEISYMAYLRTGVL